MPHPSNMLLTAAEEVYICVKAIASAALLGSNAHVL